MRVKWISLKVNAKDLCAAGVEPLFIAIYAIELIFVVFCPARFLAPLTAFFVHREEIFKN